MSASVDHIANITFPVRATWIVTIGIVLLSSLYYLETSSLKDTIQFFAACCAAGGAILAAFYAARSVNHSVSVSQATARKADELAIYNKKNNALKFGARWNNANMYHVREVVREIFSHNHDDPKLKECIEEKKTNVVHFLNFLEELAISIEADVVDKELIRVQFGGTVTSGWNILESWIKDHRKELKRPRIWIKVEELVKEWN